MLINSAGYKVLTSVEQYLELVNTSLPGESGGGGILGVPPHPHAAQHPKPLGRGGFVVWAYNPIFPQVEPPSGCSAPRKPWDADGDQQTDPPTPASIVPVPLPFSTSFLLQASPPNRGTPPS